VIVELGLPINELGKISSEFEALRPMGGADVLYVDPPWKFETRSEKGLGKSPEKHYRTMTVAEICSVPVPILPAKDCVLFIWCTWPLQPHWQTVIKTWGFEYAGLAWEWIKYNPKTDKYAFGGGYGTRKNLEPCLMATKGSPKMRDRVDGSFFGMNQKPEGVRSVRDFIQVMPLDAIRSPLREHSRKPDEAYERIETLFDGRKVELFARTTRKGWKSWGNETNKFVGDEI